MQAAHNPGISEWFSQTRGEARAFCGSSLKPGDIRVVLSSGSLKPGEKRQLFVEAARNPGVSKWFSETRGEVLGFVQAAHNPGISEWFSQTRGEAGTFCGGRPKPGDIQVVSARFFAGRP